MADAKAALVEKYRATWQFKRALEIISPEAQHRADCERDIVEALMSVERWRGIKSSRRTPAELRKLLQKLAKTLRVAIDLADQLEPYDLLDFGNRRRRQPVTNRQPKKITQEN
jgi:hypothetical protein